MNGTAMSNQCEVRRSIDSIQQIVCIVSKLFLLKHHTIYKSNDDNSPKTFQASFDSIHSFIHSFRAYFKQDLQLHKTSVYTLPFSIVHVNTYLHTKICSAYLLKYLYSTSSSPLLLRGSPDYSIDMMWELTRRSATGNCE